MDNENKSVCGDSAENTEIGGSAQKSSDTPKVRGGRWFLKCAIIMLSVFLLPALTVLTVIFLLNPVYNETFVGELYEKYSLLTETEEPKIVIVGGSSVAFGIDSALIEQEMGMKVVNFGLYADLGTKVMLDLSRSGINEGDIIILAPELNGQTLSLYFNGKTAWQALDGSFEMLEYIDSENYGALIGGALSFAQDKLGYAITGTLPENDGAYKKENFNEYGDNIYPRPYNVMSGTAGDVNFDFITDFNDGYDTDYENFINYVNDYIHYATVKGAKVYYSFCPISGAALSKDVTEDKIDAYYENLRESLDCPVISNIYDYILDDGYFFDTEFHLNDAGVVMRSVSLINDLRRLDGNHTVAIPYDKLPPPPGHNPEGSEADGEEGAEYFTFESYAYADKTYYRVTGLSAAGLAMEELTIPNKYQGCAVKQIAANAFSGSSELKRLFVGTNISFISAEAFSGASSLTEVYLPDGKRPADISVPNSMANALATKGCNPDLKIFVDADKFEGYIADYNWGDYSDFLAKKDS